MNQSLALRSVPGLPLSLNISDFDAARTYGLLAGSKGNLPQTGRGRPRPRSQDVDPPLAQTPFKL